MDKEHTNSQRILLLVLYGLIALMIFFSVLSIKDKSLDGYNNCIQEKCERKSQAFCQKPREIMSCCQGAGGQLTQNGAQLTCVFS
ncbi:TPA: hypothetical protein HA242_06825 [Candidatus Woesearchaeota archaeon]|nr:hypothetical protein [Candidatus Woesearchaeota archaeon]HIG92821.1 hypothetical protein [Candidatus Woesearchaeota archaeon]HIH13407.1 hypothetical protein [Candidatus Woesearchaeota archaeon]